MRRLVERIRGLDPRLYQITSLSCLLVYGFVALSFEITPLQAGLTLAAALGTQFVCTKIWKLPVFDPKSALISGLSLCLLLRTNNVWLAAAAAAIAIASKFVI